MTVFESFVLVSIVILVFYVNNIGGRLRRAERSVGALLHGRSPSDRVRTLAADPKTRTEAIQAFRNEADVDIRVAIAVVQSLSRVRP